MKPTARLLTLATLLAPKFTNAQVWQAAAPADFWILLNDAQGHLLQKLVVSGEQSFSKDLKTSDLPSGTYLLTVVGKDGAASQQLTVLH